MPKKDEIIDFAEDKLSKREIRRAAKKKKKMPVHGAAVKKIGKIWEKRLRGNR